MADNNEIPEDDIPLEAGDDGAEDEILANVRLPVRTNEADDTWQIILEENIRNMRTNLVEALEQRNTERRRRRVAEYTIARVERERNRARRLYDNLLHINDERPDDSDDDMALDEPDLSIPPPRELDPYELREENRRLRTFWQDSEQHRVRNRSWMESAAQTLEITRQNLDASSLRLEDNVAELRRTLNRPEDAEELQERLREEIGEAVTRNHQILRQLERAIAERRPQDDPPVNPVEEAEYAQKQIQQLKKKAQELRDKRTDAEAEAERAVAEAAISNNLFQNAQAEVANSNQSITATLSLVRQTQADLINVRRERDELREYLDITEIDLEDTRRERDSAQALENGLIGERDRALVNQRILRRERDDAVTARDGLRRDALSPQLNMDMMRRGRDNALQERDAARAARDEALRVLKEYRESEGAYDRNAPRDNNNLVRVTRERDVARAERDQAILERNDATADSANARNERDQAQQAMQQVVVERDGLRTERDGLDVDLWRARETSANILDERNNLDAALRQATETEENIRKERDDALRERDDLLRQLDAIQRELDEAKTDLEKCREHGEKLSEDIATELQLRSNLDEIIDDLQSELALNRRGQNNPEQYEEEEANVDEANEDEVNEEDEPEQDMEEDANVEEEANVDEANEDEANEDEANEDEVNEDDVANATGERPNRSNQKTALGNQAENSPIRPERVTRSRTKKAQEGEKTKKQGKTHIFPSLSSIKQLSYRNHTY